MYFLGVVGMDENVEWGWCVFVKKECEVILILLFVELVGMLIGLVMIMWIIYVSFVSVYVYFVDCCWESDVDKKVKVYDDVMLCKDIGKI